MFKVLLNVIRVIMGLIVVIAAGSVLPMAVFFALEKCSSIFFENAGAISVGILITFELVMICVFSDKQTAASCEPQLETPVWGSHL